MSNKMSDRQKPDEKALNKIANDSLKQAIESVKTKQKEVPVIPTETLVEKTEQKPVEVPPAKLAATEKKQEPSVALNEAIVVSKQQFDLKTDYLSDETKQAHLQLYSDCVEAFNKNSAELDGVETKLPTTGGPKSNPQLHSLIQDGVYNMNAIKLHELYFGNIGDLASVLTMNSIPCMRLTNEWGTFNDWQHEFIACCLSTRNGWAITGYDMFLQKYCNYIIDLHNISVPVGVIPVVVMDMWEHAYFADYQNEKLPYVFAMMKQLNWNAVEKRMLAVEKAAALFGSLNKQ